MKIGQWLGCAVGLALLAPLARGQEAAVSPDSPGGHVSAPRLVRVMLEFIQLPHAEMTKLMSGPRQSGNDTALRGELAKLIEAGKAGVMETMICTSRSGQKATIESNQEFIYPTEYEPPTLPGTFSSDPKQEASPPAGHKAIPLPTAFDNRNLGSTCEVEPTLAEDNKSIDVRITPEIVYLAGEKVWAKWQAPTGDASVKMPKFYRLAVNTGVVVADGQPTLVAALSPKDEHGLADLTQKVMVFVRCDVLEVGR